jgi:hypothetical protein
MEISSQSGALAVAAGRQISVSQLGHPFCQINFFPGVFYRQITVFLFWNNKFLFE